MIAWKRPLHVGTLVAALGTMASCPALAQSTQSAAVPPSRQAEVTAEAVSTGVEVFGGAVDASNAAGAIGRFTGVATWTRSNSKVLGTLSGGLSKIGTAADLAAAYYRDGTDGVVAEVKDKAAEWVVTEAIKVSVTGGSPLLGVAFDGGVVVGNGIKAGAKALFDYDIEAKVTDGYYHVFRGWAEEAAFERNTSDAAIEAHRQKLRDRHQAAAVDHQRTAAQDRAAAAAVPESPPASSSPSSSFSDTQAFLSIIAATATAIQDAKASQKPNGACNKVYKTPDGCHPGHDETAHPGGCKC